MKRRSGAEKALLAVAIVLVSLMVLFGLTWGRWTAGGDSWERHWKAIRGESLPGMVIQTEGS